jgi:hypothetical protein
MRNIIIGIIIVFVVIIAIVFFFVSLGGPDLSKFEYLKQPQISEKSQQRMLVVEVKGDPSVVAGKAFGTLFQVYYKLENNSKSFKVAPLGRWLFSFDTRRDQWLGRYALPVADTAQLPKNFKSNDPNIKVELNTWEYGTVAEVLHVGPYNAEAPTINKLLAFIKTKGYRIIGEHEEEYLKGPGMFFKGDPNKYYTIIRYQIAK